MSIEGGREDRSIVERHPLRDCLVLHRKGSSPLSEGITAGSYERGVMSLNTSIVDPRPPDEIDRRRSLLVLLQRVWTYSFTTKADIARDYADEIAEAASRGFLTTVVVPDRTHPVYGRVWKITWQGLEFLYEHAAEIAAQEVRNYVESYVSV